MLELLVVALILLIIAPRLFDFIIRVFLLGIVIMMVIAIIAAYHYGLVMPPWQ